MAGPQPEPIAPREPAIAHRTRSRAPRMGFLQLGEVQMHRSVLEARQYAGITKEKRIYATTLSIVHLAPKVDKTAHKIDRELIIESEDEVKIWAFLMTQYNLMPGPRKFDTKGVTATMDKLTQLHMMDTWTATDPSNLTQEDQMKVLSLLFFLKEKRTGKIKGKACINGVPQQA